MPLLASSDCYLFSDVAANRVGYWPFDADNPLKDMAGNNDATVNGNVERARGINGELDGSYQFAG